MSNSNSNGGGMNLTDSSTETPLSSEQAPFEQPITSTSTNPIMKVEDISNTGKKSNKLVLVVIIFMIALVTVVGYFSFRYVQEKMSKNVFFDNPPGENIIVQNTEIIPKEPQTKPLMAPDFLDKRFWEYVRNEEIDTNTAKNILNSDVGKKRGAIQVSNNDALIHRIEYKGIPIMWTDNQPIPAQKIEWLKKAIDLVPETFLNKYPINGIYSATKEDLKIELPAWSALNLPGIIGFASGNNIFVTSYFTTGKTTSTMYSPPTEANTITLLVHEWTHIAQFYEEVKTFTDEYLSTGVPVAHMTRFVKDYAKTAGWVFDNGEFLDDGSFLLATLGSDSASQKIASYGKTQYREDQAEAFSLFFTCYGNQLSSARISWIEKEFDIKYSTICE